MPLPTRQSFKGALVSFQHATFELGPLVTRLTFTLIFWSATFAIVRFAPLLRSPVLAGPLTKLGEFVDEQVNIWVIAFQLLALIVTLLLSMVPLPVLESFRKASFEEAFRLYYNACLAVAGYSLLFQEWKSFVVFLLLGCAYPLPFAIIYRQYPTRAGTRRSAVMPNINHAPVVPVNPSPANALDSPPSESSSG